MVTHPGAGIRLAETRGLVPVGWVPAGAGRGRTRARHGHLRRDGAVGHGMRRAYLMILQTSGEVLSVLYLLDQDPLGALRRASALGSLCARRLAADAPAVQAAARGR